jgi:hypothetical protein
VQYKDIKEANKRVAYLEASLNCFLTGEVSTNNTDPTQIALARWGRARLDYIKKTPKLLMSE